MDGLEDAAAPMAAAAPGASAAPVEAATTASSAVGRGQQDGAGAKESDEDEGSGSGSGSSSSDEDEDASEVGKGDGDEPLVDDLAMAALAAGLDDVVCGAPTGIAADGVVSAPSPPVGLPVPEVVEEGKEGAERLLEIAKEIERVRAGRNF